MLHIDEVLKKQGVGITELAKRLGVDRQTVYYYIKQGNKNSVITLEKIASAIGIDLVDLFESKHFQDNLCPHCGKEIHIKLEK